MSGVFRNIDPPPPHRPASVKCTPLRLWCVGDDTLAGWRGGGGSIVWKTPDTALYSIYVSTLCRIKGTMPTKQSLLFTVNCQKFAVSNLLFKIQFSKIVNRIILSFENQQHLQCERDSVTTRYKIKTFLIKKGYFLQWLLHF